MVEYCLVENGQSRAASPNDRGGAFSILNSNPVIKNCTLRNNIVSRYGAAIYCDGGSPLIEGCAITGNLAGYSSGASGGAMYFTNNSQPQIIDNTISHNQVIASGGFSAANGRGGAIFLDHSDASIRNNVIGFNTVHAEGNVPTYARGGAVYIYYFDPLLTGNTVYGNEVTVYSSPGEGGGLFVYGSNPLAVNNIS